MSGVDEKAIGGHGVFVGRHPHSLDSKRRVTIPSDWRAQVGMPQGFYVLPGIDQKCLCAFPAAEMFRRMEKMRQHSFTDARARQFARVLASQSELLEWDSQGRIRIKDDLLNFAGLVDQVELIGTFDSFELWNPDHLQQSGALDRSNLQEAARYMEF
ncbi:MAG: hypothetical protein A2498_07300 [Lentisphaerae bacterium RIFOXYC12_FULL_60_16]|nr:MAG: hypothetical protein A2498_07300 [Lentisphaerae bacterium RIFOXYC12_FULL_60_16]OGV68673.1 MAG: hypothetical protein A2269_03665 [Lentisphaerae bacterium RIFOXYA12_FULL_60_10]OGV86469.1 MAG: hypothetical protein A2340_08975 [Lentisphaerae bacterium RIFOXYB12_FULL_60_10]